MGYSLWGHKESDTTECLTHTHTWIEFLPFCLLFFFWPHCVACGVLVPRPGICPVPPVLEGSILTPGLLEKSHGYNFLFSHLATLSPCYND